MRCHQVQGDLREKEKAGDFFIGEEIVLLGKKTNPLTIIHLVSVKECVEKNVLVMLKGLKELVKNTVGMSILFNCMPYFSSNKKMKERSILVPHKFSY
jgi:hypothetical protein